MNAGKQSGRGPSGPLALFSGTVTSTLLLLGGLAIIDAFALWFILRLLADRVWFLAIALIVITVGVNAAFLSPRLYPFRWFSPGLSLMVLMVAYPTLFTVYTAFTNYKTGNLLGETQAIARIEGAPEYRYLPEGEQYYNAIPYRNDEGRYLLWLVGRTDQQIFTVTEDDEIQPVTPEQIGLEGVEELEDVAEGEPPIAIEGAEALSAEEAAEALADVDALEYGYPLGSVAVQPISDPAAVPVGWALDPEQMLLVDNTGSRPDEYQAFLFRPAEGEGFILYAENGDPLLAWPDGRVVIDGQPQTIGNYRILSNRERIAVTQTLPTIEFGEPGNAIFVDPFSANRAGRFRQRYHYDEARDVFVDEATGALYSPRDGTFTLVRDSVSADVAEELPATLSPGYYKIIGFDNFERLFTDHRLRGPFVRIFLWTIAHAFLAVFLTFSLGLALALLLNDKLIPGRKIWRSLILIPYAIPSFISTLVWRGLLNPRLGLINDTLERFLGEGNGPAWYSDPIWAKVAILLIQLWLGFPYMMLICTGALQSIPQDMYEAAEVDGANSFQRFRHLTLPLLLVAVGPLLIASFAYNFNNFTVIELFNEGGPPIANSSVPAGHTDILITYTYEQAFGSGGGTNYAFASAITLVIFLLVATITIFNYRFTRSWEETSQNV